MPSRRAGPLGIPATKLHRASVERLRTVKLSSAWLDLREGATLVHDASFHFLLHFQSLLQSKWQEGGKKRFESNKVKEYPIHFFHSWKWLNASC